MLLVNIGKYFEETIDTFVSLQRYYEQSFQIRHQITVLFFILPSFPLPRQSCAQFLRSNEAAVLEAVGLVAATDQVEIFGEQAGNGIGGGGNQCSAHYGVRSNSNPGIGAIQHTNNATGGFHHYSSASHAPKRRASDTP